MTTFLIGTQIGLLVGQLIACVGGVRSGYAWVYAGLIWLAFGVIVLDKTL